MTRDEAWEFLHSRRAMFMKSALALIGYRVHARRELAEDLISKTIEAVANAQESEAEGQLVLLAKQKLAWVVRDHFALRQSRMQEALSGDYHLGARAQVPGVTGGECAGEMSSADRTPCQRDQFADFEALEELRRIEERMPKSYQGLLTMVFCGYTIEEIANVCDISVKAAKSRVYRARKKAQEIRGVGA